MFNSLTGHVTGHDFPALYLTTGAMEWSLEVSAATFQTALATPHQQELRLFVHLHVREDALKLFGFASLAERGAFLELLTVPGIGPRQALKILSSTSVEALSQMLEGEDVAALTRLPGLGTRTAQKMILQLRGRLATEPAEANAGVSSAGGPYSELVAALVEMGFDAREAEAALEAAAGEIGAALPEGAAREQDLFRRAIVTLSGGVNG